MCRADAQVSGAAAEAAIAGAQCGAAGSYLKVSWSESCETNMPCGNSL